MPFLEIILLERNTVLSIRLHKNDATPLPDQRRSLPIRVKMDNLLIPSTFNKLSLLTVKGWIGLGSILSAIFLLLSYIS